MRENTMQKMNYNNFLGHIITELGFVMWGVLAWVYMSGLFLAINGIREFVFVPGIGADLALPLSGLLEVFTIFAMAYTFMCCIQFPRNDVAYWILGAVWVLLTVSFEYVMQVQLLGRDVSELAKVFLFKGVIGENIYIPIILPVFAAPWMLSQLRRNAGKKERGRNR